MITHAAIRKDGKVYVGKRHNEIISDMRAQGLTGVIPQAEQGFLTDKGEFVTREDFA